MCMERRPGGGESFLRLPIKHCFEVCLALEVAFSSAHGVRSSWVCRAISKGAEQAPGTARPAPCNWFSVQAGVLQEGSEVSLIAVSVLGSRRSEARQASPSLLTQGCVHRAVLGSLWRPCSPTQHCRSWGSELCTAAQDCLHQPWVLCCAGQASKLGIQQTALCCLYPRFAKQLPAACLQL